MDMPLVNEPPQDDDLMSLTANLVAAYVSNNSLSTTDLPRLIGDTYKALKAIALGTVAEPTPELVPAVSVRKSVTSDYIICLDDGKQFRSMKRHITKLGMTPDEYRTKWGLPFDYPMVAPNYSATRSELAKSSGLGKKPVEVEAKAAGPKRKAKAKA